MNPQDILQLTEDNHNKPDNGVTRAWSHPKEGTVSRNMLKRANSCVNPKLS